MSDSAGRRTSYSSVPSACPAGGGEPYGCRRRRNQKAESASRSRGTPRTTSEVAYSSWPLALLRRAGWRRRGAPPLAATETEKVESSSRRSTSRKDESPLGACAAGTTSTPPGGTYSRVHLVSRVCLAYVADEVHRAGAPLRPSAPAARASRRGIPSPPVEGGGGGGGGVGRGRGRGRGGGRGGERGREKRRASSLSDGDGPRRRCKAICTLWADELDMEPDSGSARKGASAPSTTGDATARVRTSPLAGPPEPKPFGARAASPDASCSPSRPPAPPAFPPACPPPSRVGDGSLAASTSRCGFLARTSSIRRPAYTPAAQPAVKRRRPHDARPPSASRPGLAFTHQQAAAYQQMASTTPAPASSGIGTPRHEAASDGRAAGAKGGGAEVGVGVHGGRAGVMTELCIHRHRRDRACWR